jgi:predicted dehydrogenase
VKIRTTLLGGDKKMLIWNDLEADEKIKVYDKGVVVNSAEGVHKLLVSYRSGDMWAPKIEPNEALKDELSYFYDCIVQGRRPANDGIAGWRVVRMIEAACRSMKNRGETVLLEPTGTRSARCPQEQINNQSGKCAAA